MALGHTGAPPSIALCLSHRVSLWSQKSRYGTSPQWCCPSPLSLWTTACPCGSPHPPAGQEAGEAPCPAFGWPAGQSHVPRPRLPPQMDERACPDLGPHTLVAWPALPPTQGICLPSWWGGDLTCEPQTINVIPPTHLCLSGFAGVWKKWGGGSCHADPGRPGSTA